MHWFFGEGGSLLKPRAPEPPVPEADLSRDGFDEVLQEIRKVESAAGSWGENASFLIISARPFCGYRGRTHRRIRSQPGASWPS